MFVTLIVVVVLFAIGAAVAMVRGLLAFSREGDVIKSGGDAFLARGKAQNRMMLQRVLFQAIAIVAVALIGFLFAKH